MADDFKYAGFISYSHSDEAIAARLHTALENFKAPKDIRANTTYSLSPIFRDTAELTAHHSLTEKIRDAVNGSRFLIVICSPAAKQSHWVNEEIKLFRERHGEASILCALAAGTPETAFPPALLAGGREPLAANLGATRDGFRLGVTQLAASMLGVGLDELIRRDTQRRRRRLQAVSISALAFSAVMGAAAFSAIAARNDANENRLQAESLVEYMITDMKDQLAPLEKLELMESIGNRAIQYYEAQDIKKLPDESLARQAGGRLILGQVALATKDIDKAKREIQAASALTQGVLARNPDDTNALYAHAQSGYWMGELYNYQSDFTLALQHAETYAALTKRLQIADPDSFDMNMERAWGLNNLGYLHRNLNKADTAKTYFQEAIQYFERALDISPNSTSALQELVNVYAGLSQIAVNAGDVKTALAFRQKQLNIYGAHLAENPDNYTIRFRNAQALSHLATGGLLDNNPVQLSATIEASYDEYDALLDYEPSNLAWRTDYILYLKALQQHAMQQDQLGINLDRIKSRLEELSAP